MSTQTFLARLVKRCECFDTRRMHKSFSFPWDTLNRVRDRYTRLRKLKREHFSKGNAHAAHLTRCVLRCFIRSRTDALLYTHAKFSGDVNKKNAHNNTYGSGSKKLVLTAIPFVSRPHVFRVTMRLMMAITIRKWCSCYKVDIKYFAIRVQFP